MGKITILTILLGVVLGLGLFGLKHEVRRLEKRLSGLNQEITDNRRAVRVLKAEWSHLNDPRRLRRLTRNHLNLNPLEDSQFVTWDALPKVLPSRSQEDQTTPERSPGNE